MIVDAEIEGPLAWTRDSLAEGAGYLRLSGQCWDEIEAVADHLRRHPLPTLALRPDDFELEACRALIADARRLLDAGPGFVVLDRLPLEGLSRDEAVQAYWLLGSLLARPVAQKWDGTMVYDVRDYGRPPGNGVRPDRTNVEQSFHTDNSYNLCPPEYVGLLCLQTAMEGGVSQVVSLATTHNALRREHPDALPRLYRPFCFDRQREHEPGDVLVDRHPIFERDGDRLTWRLSRFQVVNGHQLAEEPLDAEGAAALDALDAVMARPAMHAEFRFQPGQIQLVANRVVAHKRTAFRDWPEPERARHLVRLWLRDRGRRSYHG